MICIVCYISFKSAERNRTLAMNKRHQVRLTTVMYFNISTNTIGITYTHVYNLVCVNKIALYIYTAHHCVPSTSYAHLRIPIKKIVLLTGSRRILSSEPYTQTTIILISVTASVATSTGTSPIIYSRRYGTGTIAPLPAPMRYISGARAQVVLYTYI